MDCLLSFGAESFVFQFENQKLKNNIYGTTILPVVLYGCETWSVTLRHEHRLRVLQNTVLKKISGPKRDEVLAEWRRLNIRELYDLYSSRNIIWVMKARRMSWVGHVAYMGDRGVYRVLVGKPEGKRSLRKHRHRWKDNIKMDIQEVGLGNGPDWSVSGEGQIAGSCVCGNEPSGSIKCKESLE